MKRKSEHKSRKLISNLLILLLGALFALIFPFRQVVAQLAVTEVGETVRIKLPQINSSVVSGTNDVVQLLGEIMAPIYQLATPGSNLTYDIYRYLMKHTENELGIDKDFFRRLKRKVDAPTVDIVFAPTNPKEGQRVTAFAIPRGFRNSKQKLYFTWYLVHEGQDDVQAGRDEAMGMVARGGYDKDLFGETREDDGDRDAYNATFGGDDGVGGKSGLAVSQNCNGCDCLHNMTMFGGDVRRGCFDDKGQLLYSNLEEYDEAVSDLGPEKANWGKGVVNSDWITRCYRHNFGRKSGDGEEYSGRDMIIRCQHAFNHSLGGGDNSFSRAEEDAWMTNPGNPDTDGDGVVDEADLLGLGQDEFTWIYHKGDRVTVAVEGVSNIMINEGATNRLRYENKNRAGRGTDLSPGSSPEAWYIAARNRCERTKSACLAATGSSEFYVPVSSRLTTEGRCIREYADCMKEVWEHRRNGNDEEAFGDLTGYYKIMWAAPGICSQENRDEAKNDWCDNRDDFGFQYLKLYDPVERGKQLMEVSVTISPKNPQFFRPSEDDCGTLGGFCYMFGDGTDMILASADVVSDDNVNPDYLYYKWSVWRCRPTDFTDCEDVTDFVYPVSQLEGVGVRDFGFYPLNDLFIGGGDKSLLKVGVVVKKHRNAIVSSPGVNGNYEKQIMSDAESFSSGLYVGKYAYTASSLVEVHRNNSTIKLYTAIPDGSGGWEKGREICSTTGSLYKKVCPVFPYQVLMAELDTEEGDIGDVIWKINGKIIKPSRLADVNTEPNSPRIFFPVTGTEGELGIISAVTNRGAVAGGDGDTFVTERIFSIHNPLPVVIDSGRLTRTSITKALTGGERAKTFQGHQLWWIVGYPSNVMSSSQDDTSDGFQTTVDIPIKIIPNYLRTGESGIKLKVTAFLNGNYVGEVHNEDLENNDWVFHDVTFTRVRTGDVNTVNLKTMLQFDDNYKEALKKSFNISPVEELYNQQMIKVKPIEPEYYRAVSGQEVGGRVSLKDKGRMMMASVINKTPGYLISIFKVATVLVLMTMIVFSTAYGLDLKNGN